MDVYSCGFATYGSVLCVSLAWKLAGGTGTPEALSIFGQSQTHIIVYIAPTGVSMGFAHLFWQNYMSRPIGSSAVFEILPGAGGRLGHC